MSSDQHNPFDEMARLECDDHPLDLYVMTQIPSEMTENIATATKALIGALDGDSRPWIDLEFLLNEYRQKCEEILYNRGYENGFVACGVAAAAKFRTPTSNIDYHALSEQLRKWVGVSPLSLSQRILALLDVAVGILQRDSLK